MNSIHTFFHATAANLKIEFLFLTINYIVECLHNFSSFRLLTQNPLELMGHTDSATSDQGLPTFLVPAKNVN